MDSSPRPARLAVIAALIAAFAAMPGDAHALRFTPEQIDAITEHTRRGAPVEAQCGQTCAALRQTELTANTRTTPAWRRVIGQANNLRARAGLIGRVPLHASATVAAAAGAAYVGFKLGEGVNAKFFRFGIFGDDNVRPNVAQYTLQHYAANAGIPTDTDPAYISVDYPSWQLSYRFTTDSATHRRRAFYRSHNPPTAECDSSPNIDYTHLVWQGTDNCQVGYRQWKPYGIEWGVHLIPSFGHRSGPHPDGPIEDYTGQPVQIYVPDPDDPGPQATRDSVVEQLEQNASSYPDLVEWYEFHLGVPGSRDPITGRVRVPGYADSPGQPYAEYAAELERLGLEPVRVEADEPDFDFEEEAVLEVDPGVGVVVEPSAEVRITANPGGWLGKRHPDCERNEAPPGDPAFRRRRRRRTRSRSAAATRSAATRRRCRCSSSTSRSSATRVPDSRRCTCGGAGPTATPTSTGRAGDTGTSPRSTAGRTRIGSRPWRRSCCRRIRRNRRQRRSSTTDRSTSAATARPVVAPSWSRCCAGRERSRTGARRST
jgi:hypothetical protein